MAKEQDGDLFENDETTIESDPLAGAKEAEKKEAAEEKPNIQVEVVDDMPEEDRRVLEARKRRQDKADHDVELAPLPGNKDDLEKEIAEYGKRSQKRIRQLYDRFHDERRVAEEAQRAREEAIRFAETIRNENQKLKETLSQGEKYLIEQVKKKAELALDAAKKQYKEAFESGDPEKIASATEAMSQAVAEKREADAFKSREALQPEKKDVQGDREQSGTDHRASQQQRPQAPDPRAVQWAEKNKWFGSDKTMTAYAYGLHQQLVVDEGVDPRSDEYYSRIDREIRKRFPEKFEASQESRTETRSAPQRTVVAGVTRTPSSKKVTLTATQAALAKRLGVPLEVYAQEVLKESGNA